MDGRDPTANAAASAQSPTEGCLAPKASVRSDLISSNMSTTSNNWLRPRGNGFPPDTFFCVFFNPALSSAPNAADTIASIHMSTTVALQLKLRSMSPTPWKILLRL